MDLLEKVYFNSPLSKDQVSFNHSFTRFTPAFSKKTNEIEYSNVFSIYFFRSKEQLDSDSTVTETNGPQASGFIHTPEHSGVGGKRVNSMKVLKNT